MATAKDRKRRQEIADILSKQSDIASLTDEELRQRSDLLGEFGTGSGKLVDQSKLARTIAEIANLNGVTEGFDNDKNEGGNAIASLAIELGRYPTPDEIKGLYPGGKPIGGGVNNANFQNFINSQKLRNEIGAGLGGGAYDSFSVNEQDVKNTQDLLAGRAEKSSRDRAVDEYLGGLPGELSSSRQDYLSSLTAGAEGEFEKRVPRELSSLNARGALRSGAAGDTLATTASEIYAPIQRIQAQLESDDNDFYFNMAYQNKVRQLLETSADWRTALDVERSNVRTKQNQDFVTSQNNLNSLYSQNLQGRDYERQMAAVKQRLDEASQANSKSQTSKLIGAGAGAAGAIAAGAATAGNPVAIGAGYQIGSGTAQSFY